jgi:DNA-directed RNA polymerase subunit omega
MDVIKQGDKLDPRVASRYTVVLAAAKRARQLTEGAEPLTYAPTERAVSIAIKEMNEGKLRVKVQEELIDINHERLMKDQHKYAISALSKDDLDEGLKDDYSRARTYATEEDDDLSTEDLYQEDLFAAVAAEDGDVVNEADAKADIDLGETEVDPEENFDEID